MFIGHLYKDGSLFPIQKRDYILSLHHNEKYCVASIICRLAVL
jgi:hypothetical protein